MKKSEQAYQIAVQALSENPDIDESFLRSRIKESIPCSRTLAYKAVKKAKNALIEHEEAKPPTVHKVAPLEAKPPEIIPQIEPVGEPPRITEIEKPLTPEEGEPEFIRDMLQNLHELFLSQEGLLEKYGVSESEARGVGSQCYEVLKHRVGIENLRDYDIYLLIASYLGLVGKIGVKVWRDRRKTKKKEKPKESSQKS